MACVRQHLPCAGLQGTDQSADAIDRAGRRRASGAVGRVAAPGQHGEPEAEAQGREVAGSRPLDRGAAGESVQRIIARASRPFQHVIPRRSKLRLSHLVARRRAAGAPREVDFAGPVSKVR